MQNKVHPLTDQDSATHTGFHTGPDKQGETISYLAIVRKHLECSGSSLSQLAINILLCIVMILTPYEAIFPSNNTAGSYVYNRIVEIGFFVDLVYRIKEHRIKQLVRIHSYHDQTVPHYVFFLDIIAMVPWDLFTLINETGGVRLLRLIRLAKLIRYQGVDIQKLYRSVMGHSIEDGSHFSNVLILFSIGAFISYATHWTACFWRVIPLFEHGQLSTYAATSSWLSVGGIEDDDSSFHVYTMALQWSAVTLLPMGTTNVVPSSSTEFFIASIVSVLGFLLLLFSSGVFFGPNIALLLRETHFPRLLGVKLENPPSGNGELDAKDYARRHVITFKEFYSRKRMLGELKELSESVRELVYSKMFSYIFNDLEWLNSATILSEDRKLFVRKMAPKLKSEIFTSGTRVFSANDEANTMYFIDKGQVECDRRVYNSGESIGNDFILSHFRREYSAIALVDTIVYAIYQADVYQLLSTGNFPSIRESFARAVMKLSLKNKLPVYMSQIHRDYLEGCSFNGSDSVEENTNHVLAGVQYTEVEEENVPTIPSAKVIGIDGAVKNLNLNATKVVRGESEDSISSVVGFSWK